MKQRCLNKNRKDYRYYGGRGIRIHQPWISNFDSFLKDVGLKPSDKHSLDRIDPEGDYEPGNVRWADKTTQSRNQRLRKDNTTGMKGVNYSSSTGKWMVRISTEEGRIYLGCFSDLEKAKEIRLKAEKKHWN